ncbi:MAG: winged helix-turn-helix domain-containing protein [Steroidobacterales bacterium]
MKMYEGMDLWHFTGFSLDPRRRQLFAPDGRVIPLSARAFDTLLCLVEHPNQVVDKRMLMKAVWPNAVVEENNLNQHISIVRRALGETPGEHRFIVTVKGRGFVFVPTVSKSRPPAELAPLLRLRVSSRSIVAAALLLALAAGVSWYVTMDSGAAAKSSGATPIATVAHAPAHR